MRSSVFRVSIDDEGLYGNLADSTDCVTFVRSSLEQIREEEDNTFGSKKDVDLEKYEEFE